MCDYMKPTAQCAKAAKTAGTVLGQLNRPSTSETTSSSSGSINSNVLPHLDFAIQAWNPWRAKDKEVLQKVHRRAIGMVSGLKVLSTKRDCVS